MPLFCLRKLGDLMWGTERRKATTSNVDLSQIIQLVQRMKNLLGSDSRVYAEYEGPNLPLTRYLDKIVSLHVSADACFVLTTVSNTPYTGYLPTTREQWMAYLQKALSYTSYETSSMKFVDGTQGMDEEYELRIHCEVALTLYLREHWKAYTVVGNALGSDIYAHGWAFLRTYSDSSIDSTAVSKEEEDDDKQWVKAVSSHSNYLLPCRT
ncbi:hypothetical protein L211DRAFT_868420 [Terfezia boudieri ATCC MYA-4762]|uniref:Uncharacterized protein n=1 Tax=Terfezia boudieri ATCC MYA-4762 TaxID=1051890 RepID=A0A3N4LLR6_9PEZI|nr:hypothetical protein L211DRAFT_868420 [Terfezia boudieri ATCC MYA-4762]